MSALSYNGGHPEGGELPGVGQTTTYLVTRSAMCKGKQQGFSFPTLPHK